MVDSRNIVCNRCHIIILYPGELYQYIHTNLTLIIIYHIVILPKISAIIPKFILKLGRFS